MRLATTVTSESIPNGRTCTWILMFKKRIKFYFHFCFRMEILTMFEPNTVTLARLAISEARQAFSKLEHLQRILGGKNMKESK